MHHRLPISLALPCKVRLIFQRIFLIVLPLSLHLREGFSLCSLSIKPVVVFVQFSSVTHLCPTLCDPMDCSMLDFPCPSLTPGACSKLCSSLWWSIPSKCPFFLMEWVCKEKASASCCFLSLSLSLSHSYNLFLILCFISLFLFVAPAICFSVWTIFMRYPTKNNMQLFWVPAQFPFTMSWAMSSEDQDHS